MAIRKLRARNVIQVKRYAHVIKCFQEVIKNFFLGGISRKKYDHDCDQELIRSS